MKLSLAHSWSALAAGGGNLEPLRQQISLHSGLITPWRKPRSQSSRKLRRIRFLRGLTAEIFRRWHPSLHQPTVACKLRSSSGIAGSHSGCQHPGRKPQVTISTERIVSWMTFIASKYPQRLSISIPPSGVGFSPNGVAGAGRSLKGKAPEDPRAPSFPDLFVGHLCRNLCRIDAPARKRTCRKTRFFVRHEAPGNPRAILN